MERNVTKGPKRAKDAKKVSTETTESVLGRESHMAGSDDSSSKILPIIYENAARLKDSLLKEWILNSRKLPIHIVPPLKCSLQQFLHYVQACIIDRRNQAYVFLNMDTLKFVKCAAWFLWTQAALFKMGAI